MREHKICPMMEGSHEFACRGVLCAWYDSHEQQCCLLSVSRHLHEITKRLEDLNLDGMEITEETEVMVDD